MERANAWQKYTSKKDLKKVMDFGENYRQFLSKSKTERECVAFFEKRQRQQDILILRMP